MKTNTANASTKIGKIKWDNSKFVDFRGVLQNNLDQIQSAFDGVVSGYCSIDGGMGNFASILYNNAFPVFGEVKRVKTNQATRHRKFTSHDVKFPSRNLGRRTKYFVNKGHIIFT